MDEQSKFSPAWRQTKPVKKVQDLPNHPERGKANRRQPEPNPRLLPDMDLGGAQQALSEQKGGTK